MVYLKRGTTYCGENNSAVFAEPDCHITVGAGSLVVVQGNSTVKAGVKSTIGFWYKNTYIEEALARVQINDAAAADKRYVCSPDGEVSTI